MGRFQKGTSGNPGGRLRRGLSITEHLQELLSFDYEQFMLISRRWEERGETKLGRVTFARLVACRIITSALAGNAEFAKELLLRSDGREEQRLATDRGGIELNIVFENKAT